MQKGISIVLLIGLLTSTLQLQAQYNSQDTVYKKCFVGSTFALLGNFLETNNPQFAQLNIGYRLTEKDVVSLELKTWRYAWSLGIPLGSSFEAPEEKYPGYIREVGFALVYQRFWWEGLYTGVHVMSAWQTFVNEDGNKIDNGFQIFNTYRVGYHVKLFNNRFFIEPSIAVTHRPFQTEMPESFRVLNDKWNRYFIGEPGLHFGYNF
jgi:hypothetical protein